MIWHTIGPIDLGFLPDFLSEFDERPARVQLDENYRHGGGWRPQRRFTFEPRNKTIKYPGDPAMTPLAWTNLRDEEIYLYESAWLCIVQPDGSYEVSRVD